MISAEEVSLFNKFPDIRVRNRFVTLERWLGNHDALFLIRDRADPLVLLPWESWRRGAEWGRLSARIGIRFSACELLGHYMLS